MEIWHWAYLPLHRFISNELIIPWNRSAHEMMQRFTMSEELCPPIGSKDKQQHRHPVFRKIT